MCGPKRKAAEMDPLTRDTRKSIKGRVHCFSMQVLIKCFLLNPEKNLAQICLVVFEKNVKRTFNSKK